MRLANGTDEWLAGEVPHLKKIFISGFFSAGPKTSVLAGDLSAEMICASARSQANTPPASNDPFYLLTQIVCGLVKHTSRPNSFGGK
jgi:hypothetical protein